MSKTSHRACEDSRESNTVLFLNPLKASPFRTSKPDTIV
jgi:hypothetical protein